MNRLRFTLAVLLLFLALPLGAGVVQTGTTNGINWEVSADNYTITATWDAVTGASLYVPFINRWVPPGELIDGVASEGEWAQAPGAPTVALTTSVSYIPPAEHRKESRWQIRVVTNDSTAVFAWVEVELPFAESNTEDTDEEETEEETDDLAAPTNVTVTHGDAQLEVSWTNGTGADSHTVRWRTSAVGGTPAGAWTEIADATNPQTISNLENDTAYDVEVGAVAAGETTQWSSTAQGTPEEPKGPTTDEPPTTPDNAPADYTPSVTPNVNPPDERVDGQTATITWKHDRYADSYGVMILERKGSEVGDVVDWEQSVEPTAGTAAGEEISYDWTGELDTYFVRLYTRIVHEDEDSESGTRRRSHTSTDVEFELTDAEAPPVGCVEDGRYNNGHAVRKHFGYTACLYDDRFKVTAIDDEGNALPIHRRLGDPDKRVNVVFKIPRKRDEDKNLLEGRKLIYVGMPDYCGLKLARFQHYYLDAEASGYPGSGSAEPTSGDIATVTVEDLVGNATGTWTLTHSMKKTLVSQAFPCDP